MCVFCSVATQSPVNIIRPAGVVVSAHGSAKDRKPAPAAPICLGSFAGGGEILR